MITVISVLACELVNHDVTLSSGRVLEQVISHFVKAVGQGYYRQPHVMM